jgi:hypothetical protein
MQVGGSTSSELFVAVEGETRGVRHGDGARRGSFRFDLKGALEAESGCS